MIELGNKKNCSGCGACVSACPVNALSLEPDVYGFVYPVLDEEKCIHCDRCSSVCSYQSVSERESLKETYAAVADGINRAASASGGIFAGLAKSVLKDGGIVFGSALLHEDDGLTVRHISAESLDELARLQGSKYVQSSIGNTYVEAKMLLESGRLVLFSGTPCQIAGLYGYLGKDYENLYTVDIVCHGVPSEQFFKDYIRFEEEKNGFHIIDFKFRDKSQGWKLYGKMTVEKDDGPAKDLYFEPEESSYYQLFLDGHTYRENCYSCPYAGDNRVGDLTIGDYWGIEVVHPELLKESGGPFDEKTGISCLIVNTTKGKTVLECVSEIRRIQSSFQKAQAYNGQLREPSRMKPEREDVIALYQKGYKYLDKWYRRRLTGKKVRRAIRNSVPAPVKKALKRILKH